MQSQRLYRYSSHQTEVYTPPPVNNKRSTDERVTLCNVVLNSDIGQKRRKEDRQEYEGDGLDREVVVLQPIEYFEEEFTLEEAPALSKKRAREDQSVDHEVGDDELGDITRKMERVSFQIDDGGGISIDKDASLDMSDDELYRLTSRQYDFSSLTLFQAKHISDAGIIRALFGRHNVHTLSLAACPEVSGWVLHTLGNHCPNLSKLSIVKCPIDDEGMENVTSKCKNLRIINVDWCHDLTDATLESIGKNCPNLQEFTTAECSQYTLTGFKALLAGCRKIQKIEFWGCQQVTDEWIDTIITSGCRLKELDITSCPQVTIAALKRLRLPHCT